jgi:hypothetical protein
LSSSPFIFVAPETRALWKTQLGEKKMLVFKVNSRRFSQKYLITGAGGQIGQELVPYMAKQFGVDCIVTSDIRPITYDMETQPTFV